MKTKYNWTRVSNDVCGNPRYVTTWHIFRTKTYEAAINLSRSIGGRKYETPQYPGGIVFLSYWLPETEAAIDRVVGGAA